MRLLTVVFAVLLPGCGGQVPLPAQAPDSLRVASHNVHFIRLTQDRGPWSVADWNARKAALDAVFTELDADLVAFQEMVSIAKSSDRSVNLARDWLLNRNPDYGLAASGAWQSFPTRQPIFYRKDRLRLTDQGWFLYDSPDVVAHDRTRPGFWLYFATWAEFVDTKGDRFRVYNVHFHFLDSGKRRHAARMLAGHAAPVLQAGLPVLVLGDMNALGGWQTVEILRSAGLRVAQPPGATFHFNRGLDVLGAIDHVGHSPDITVLNGPWALRGQRAGDWPSDHYPVVADIALP